MMLKILAVFEVEEEEQHEEQQEELQDVEINESVDEEEQESAEEKMIRLSKMLSQLSRSRIALPVSKGGFGIPLASHYALPAYIGSYCQTRLCFSTWKSQRSLL